MRRTGSCVLAIASLILLLFSGSSHEVCIFLDLDHLGPRKPAASRRQSGPLQRNALGMLQEPARETRVATAVVGAEVGLHPLGQVSDGAAVRG